MKLLTDKQRKFLEYLYSTHNGCGWPNTINTILSMGKYDPGDMEMILRDFRCLRDRGVGDLDWGNPFKYLKG